jgi:hypothetical protein
LHYLLGFRDEFEFARGIPDEERNPLSTFGPTGAFSEPGGLSWPQLKSAHILLVHVRLRMAKSIAAAIAMMPATLQILPAVAGTWTAKAESFLPMPQREPGEPPNGIALYRTRSIRLIRQRPHTAAGLQH